MTGDPPRAADRSPDPAGPGRAPGGLPADLDVEEVRIAMALNGGVSLAVWMAGCAVELDCARRAHWGEEQLGRDPVKGGGARRNAYHSLCAAFRRELVIDILSGASAGGINGGMLAAAIVARRRLHPSYVRGRWLTLGEFGELLHQPTTPAPRSLMQGRRFASELLEVFEDIAAPEAEAASMGLALPPGHSGGPPGSIPHLDVTVTDVRGTERTYRDAWGGTFSAREYRRRFRFREQGDFTPPKLAAAARSSASFPVAFEPFRPDDASWALTAPPGVDPSREAPPWTIDGGLLDNAPIRAAIELIPTRAASRQVRRFLVYVNPEPHAPLDPGMAGVGTNADGETDTGEPELRDVLGYVVNLPRKTPFVDQLEAIERAVERSTLAADGVLPLLAAPIETIAAAAEALLPPYSSRRRLNSLRELLGDPTVVALTLKALRQADAELPWIPRTLEFDETLRWDWGLSSAIRLCHLVIDLTRLGIEVHPEHRAAFVAARSALYEELSELQAGYASARGDREVIGKLRSVEPALSPEQRAAAVQGLAGDQRSLALAAVREAIRTFARLLSELGGELTLGFRPQPGEAKTNVAVGAALLGEGWQRDSGFETAIRAPSRGRGEAPLTEPERHFLRRALSIEVVRRAFAAEEQVESTQQLSFVQLTPDAPAPIFAFEPLSCPYPASAEHKLTGIRLGHFAGFMKRSWRANDFMWGRLDAAARIVDLLVDPGRAPAVGGIDRLAERLALALAPDAGATVEQCWLIAEALVDRNGADGTAAGVLEELRTALPGSAPAQTPGLVDELMKHLRDPLKAELEQDLSGSPDALFTRMLFTRAAQLEIVRAELPAIAEASRTDVAAGSSTPPVGFGDPDPQTEELPERALMDAILNVRQGAPLPVRLGRDDPAEKTSDLSARTAARAGFVTLAALRTARLPGARALDLLRPALLAVSGVASRAPVLRIALILGYWAAGLYLAARAVDTADQTADLGSVLSKPVLLAVVAALAVLGIALLPFLRGVHRRWSPTSFAEFAAAALLFIAGGGAAVGLALGFGDRSPAQLIIAPGFEPPPEELVATTLVIVLGLSLARTPMLRRLPAAVLELTKRGTVSAALLALAGVLLSIWTVPILVDAIADGPAWRAIAAAITLALPPLTAWGYLAFRDAVERRATSELADARSAASPPP